MARFLLAFALVFSSVQCVASCASEDCGSSRTPPCHQGAPSVKACPHELVLDRAPCTDHTAVVPAYTERIMHAAADIATETVPLAVQGPAPPLSLRI